MRRNTAAFLATAVMLVTLAFAALLAVGIYQSNRMQRIIVAAGSSKAESYALMRALKTVVENHNKHIQFTILETGGTPESLAMLDRGEAQLAPAQADGAAGPNVRTVAVLYEDKFQLLVQKGSGMLHFLDLKGKRIALPPSGGQYESFLILAGYFGLEKTDFTFVGADEESASVAFASNEADALFRVRGVPNSFIRRLALTGKVEFLPVDEVSALKVLQPAYTATVIPKGAYGGNPSIPVADLHTVAVDRVLLATQSVSYEAVRAITEALMERRQELSAAIADFDITVRPLIAGIRKPQGDSLTPGLHPGAAGYYDREQPTFVASHKDLIAALIALSVLVLLWSYARNRSIAWAQQLRINEFQTTTLQLIEEARASDSDDQLEPIRAELMMIMTAAIRDLGDHRISEKAFQSFRVIWQVAFDVSQDKNEGKKMTGEPSGLEELAASSSRSSDAWWKLGTP